MTKSAAPRKLVNELIEAGYDGHYNEIDAGVAYNGNCSNCSHHGLMYRGFKTPDSYRAVAICPVCGNEEDF